MNEGEKKFGSVYFAIFGAVVLAFGVAEVVVSVPGEASWGIMEMSGMFLPWKGIILLSAGLFYLSSVKSFAEIHQLAKAVMASIMIWIVGGIETWARIAGSIPGGEEGPWFNTLEGFLATYAPPYAPSVFLLPFSLVIIYYILKEGETEK
jgi:hypothetical protein